MPKLSSREVQTDSIVFVQFFFSPWRRLKLHGVRNYFDCNVIAFSNFPHHDGLIVASAPQLFERPRIELVSELERKVATSFREELGYQDGFGAGVGYRRLDDDWV